MQRNIFQLNHIEHVLLGRARLSDLTLYTRMRIFFFFLYTLPYMEKKPLYCLAREHALTVFFPSSFCR